MFLSVEFVELGDIRSMELLREQWDGVAAHAAEPNPFYESWALLPAFQHLARGARPTVVFVWGDAARSDLIGVFPVGRQVGFHRLPIIHRGLWRHVHCFLATPLVRAGREEAAWRGFLTWSGRRGPLVALDGVGADGAVYRGLERVLAETGRRFEVRSLHSRPLLAPTVSGPEYLAGAVRKKRRRQFERKREILALSGPVTYDSADAEGELARWADDFIELESRGWKGRGRTAIRERRNEQAFFHALVRRGAARGKIRGYRLSVGGRPVAMRFDLISGRAGFAFKIAYDETYARNSPGALLEIEILQEFFERGDLSFVDSCTVPSPHSIHGYFWHEQRSIGSVVVAAPGPLGAGLLAFGQALRAAKGSRSAIPAPPVSESAQPG